MKRKKKKRREMRKRSKEAKSTKRKEEIEKSIAQKLRNDPLLKEEKIDEDSRKDRRNIRIKKKR